MIAIRAWMAAGGVALAAACGPSAKPPGGADTTATVLPGPPDSLVLTLPSGVSVWLAEGRTALDTAGAACLERSVEIRTDSSVVKVPLLFVTAAPTLLDRDHLRAELSRHCRVMAVYRVELATGRPYKLEDR